MKAEKTITLNGVTRNPYVFNLYPRETRLQPVSALFVGLKRIRFGYQVLYIGNTCDLSLDLKKPELDFTDITHIGVHIEPILSRRHAKAIDLITSYTPVLNM